VRFALLITVAVSAVALAACGGEDRLSQAEFQQRANAVCKKYNDRIAAIGDPTSPAVVPEYVDKGVPLIEQGLSELRDLNPPEDVEDDYDRMLAATEDGIPAIRKLGQAVAANDAVAVQEALQEVRRVSTTSNRLATTLGLESCAA
jgi:hypothetical protein